MLIWYADVSDMTEEQMKSIWKSCLSIVWKK